jgi:Phospholipase_D-nuclease N-terminal
MSDLGFWPLIHLALVIYALIKIFDSNADMGRKIIWTVIVALFPLVGMIVWYLIGPGTPKK